MIFQIGARRSNLHQYCDYCLNMPCCDAAIGLHLIRLNATKNIFYEFTENFIRLY